MQVLVAPAVGGPHLGARLVQEVDRPGDRYAHHHRQVEQASGGGTHALAVVGIHGRVRENDDVRPRGVGGAQYRPGVAGVAHVGEDDRQTHVGDLLQGDVDELADRDDPLRGDGLRQFGHHVQADLMRGDPGRVGGVHQVDVALHGLRRGVDLEHAAPTAVHRGERLPHSLRALREEAPLTLAEGAFGEPPNPLDPG